MKTFLKGYCCCGKIRVEMCQEHFLHIQTFYLLSYPVFPCDPFSLLGSSFAERFLIFFFLSRTVSILLSFPGIISSPAPVYETISTHWFGSFPSRYALRFLLPIQASLEAPSEQALCAAFGTSHPSPFPARERNSLWENHPEACFLHLVILIPLLCCPPVLYHLTWSRGISHSGHFLPHVVLPCVPRHYSLMCSLVILQYQSTWVFFHFFNPRPLLFLSSAL